jgi:3-hydroxyacyl-CoA dehydrogenase / enoyl-CoA hydratase / 3-hydroxybutyryl-CoA epimerase
VATDVRELLEERRLETGPSERPGERSGLRHWRRSRDDEGIEWLLLDKQGTSTNTLDEEVLGELDSVLEQLGNDRPKGLVLRSAKPNGFVAGAEIRDFRGLRDAAVVDEKIRRGHAVLDRLERFPAPSVALIHGFCLGGGLELALSCRYRIARDDAELGFPEVRLGLHPGLGGIERLTDLVSPTQSMPMMLTGKPVAARKARALGLVDVVTQERHFANAVRAAVRGEIERQGGGMAVRAMSSAPARYGLALQMRRKTEEKVRPEHYPAPFALIDLWQKHGGSRKELREAETRSFAALLTGDVAQNLIRVFFLRERLKKLGQDSDATLSHVHVIGAGTMGGDIAAWCALQGLTVTLQDQKAELIGPAIKRACKLFDDKTRSGAEARAARDGLIPDLLGQGVRRADVVIEAVPERLDLKREVYAEVEPRLKPEAILATNTSSILLERLTEGLKGPSRFVGMHFFNPVTKMPLVELVRHEGASEQTVGRALAFVARIDRLPAPVESAPGFLVNRALTPYLLEALTALDEGVPAETIDEAALAFGMPMGPVELADQVGLDICLHVAQVLQRDLDQPTPEIPGWFRDRVEQGKLGKKTGHGLYSYKDGEPQKEKVKEPPDEELRDRLILPLINTCVACRREGIVEDDEIADAAMVFGTGFAPFRGGPLHYAKERGAAEIVATLERLEGKHGPRFKPDAGWPTIVEEG